MKSFLKVLFSILALGLVASAPVLRAQDPSTPPPEGGKGEKKGGKGPRMMTVEGVEKAVGTLTAEQKTKIGGILTKAQADMKALSSEDRAKGREAFRRFDADPGVPAAKKAATRRFAKRCGL